jgi:hypothetical protein
MDAQDWLNLLIFAPGSILGAWAAGHVYFMNHEKEEAAQKPKHVNKAG